MSSSSSSGVITWAAASQSSAEGLQGWLGSLFMLHQGRLSTGARSPVTRLIGRFAPHLETSLLLWSVGKTACLQLIHSFMVTNLSGNVDWD